MNSCMLIQYDQSLKHNGLVDCVKESFQIRFIGHHVQAIWLFIFCRHNARYSCTSNHTSYIHRYVQLEVWTSNNNQVYDFLQFSSSFYFPHSLFEIHNEIKKSSTHFKDSKLLFCLIGKCQEVMSSGPTQLSSERIVLSPAGPSDLIQGQQSAGWSTVHDGDKPTVTVILTKPGNNKPTLLEKLAVLGNVKTVSVEYTTSSNGEFIDYNNNEPIDVSATGGFLVFPAGGIEAFEVKITLLSAININEPFNMKMLVFACTQGNNWFYT